MPQFDIGRVFNRAWSEYMRGIGAYLGTTFVGFFAIFVLIILGVFGLVALLGTGGLSEISQIFSSSPALGLAAVIFVAVMAILAIVVGILLGAVQYELTNQLFSGYAPNVTVAFQWAKQRFHDYFSTGILVSVGVVLGFILFIIPGIIFSVWWLLSQYLVTREGLSNSAALSRSKQLVGQAFWWVLLTLVAYNLLLSILSSIPVVGVIATLFLAAFTMPLVGALYDELRYLETSAVPAAIVSPEPTSVVPTVQQSPVTNEVAVVAVSEAAVIPGPAPMELKPVIKKLAKKPLKKTVVKKSSKK